MALTQIAKNFQQFGACLQIPQAVEPVKIIIDKVAHAGNAGVFDLWYKASRVDFSFRTFTDAFSKSDLGAVVKKQLNIKEYPSFIQNAPQAKWRKDTLSASRIVEVWDEWDKKFVWAGINSRDKDAIAKFNEAREKGFVLVRRLSFIAGALSAICENAEYFGLQKFVVVAETLSKFSKIPGLSFALSTFGRGDHFFKVISLSLSLFEDGMAVYHNTPVWQNSSSDVIRRAILSKIGKLYLIALSGTLVPEWNRTRTLNYCSVGIVVDLHGVFDWLYKCYDRPTTQNVIQSRLVPLDHSSSASALPNHVPSHTNSNHRSTSNGPITTTTTVPNPHTSTNPLPPSSTQDHSKSNVNGNENGSGEPSASSQPSSSTEEVAKSAKEKVALFDQKAVEQRIAAEKMYVHKIDADQINKHK